MAQPTAKASPRTCLLCEATRPLEEHHIYPLQWGGAANGPTVPLCDNHHTLIHTSAEDVWQHRATLESFVGDQRSLVKAICDQRAEFERSGVAPDARRRAVAHLSPIEQQALRLLKARYGFSNQEELLKWLILREAEAVAPGFSNLEKVPSPKARAAGSGGLSPRMGRL